MTRPLGVAILGSTGTVGEAALDVISRNPDRFRVVAIAGGRNLDRLQAQAETFRPEFVSSAEDGSEALTIAATWASADRVLVATPGLTALRATFSAALAGKSLAVASKEILVVAGKLLLKEARELIPIDSEHAALFDLLRRIPRDEISRVIITGSGGPFRGKKRAKLNSVTPEEALKHPTWRMGDKITIDSATLMNKALEVVEAANLFGFGPDEIAVVIHRESIVHAIVELKGGTSIASLTVPDMRAPIALALGFPERFDAGIDRLPWAGDHAAAFALNFDPIDTDAFPAAALGDRALRLGGLAPVVLNAANEIAVSKFLAGEIPFLRIADLCAEFLENHAHDRAGRVAGKTEAAPEPTLKEIEDTAAAVRSALSNAHEGEKK